MKFSLKSIAALALTLILYVFVPAQTRTDVYALTNARIVTVSGSTIEKGSVIIRDGLIEAVGADVKVPADARVIDAVGLTVYPGVFDALTNLGLAPPQTPARTTGGGPQTAPPTPVPSGSNYPVGMRPEKTVINDLLAGDSQFESVRNAGFTTVLTVGRDGVFNGQSAVINLAGETVSALVVKDVFGQHFSFRTVPGGYPASLLGTFSAFRQMVLDARRLQKMQAAYAANPRGMKRPESDRSLEALFPVVNGAVPVVFNANTEAEIVRSLDLAKELEIKAIIGGGLEAWKQADRLKAQDVPVLLTLNFPKRTAASSPDADPESLEVLRLRANAPKCAGVLAQKGVKFAFQSGGLSSPSDFFANAAKTTENGLSKDSALRAMTLAAAEILGVGNRLGSIETGKIANLTVTRGDLLAKDRVVTHVFVDGRLFEQKERPKPAANSNLPAPSAPVAGSWRITIAVPEQQLEGSLDLKQERTNLTGTLQTDATGSSPIRDGRIESGNISFTTTVTFGGSTIDLSVTGRVAGNQISGTIDSPQGAIPFSGTKVP